MQRRIHCLAAHALQQRRFLYQYLGQEVEKSPDARGLAQIVMSQQPEVEGEFARQRGDAYERRPAASAERPTINVAVPSMRGRPPTW